MGSYAFASLILQSLLTELCIVALICCLCITSESTLAGPCITCHVHNRTCMRLPNSRCSSVTLLCSFLTQIICDATVMQAHLVPVPVHALALLLVDLPWTSGSCCCSRLLGTTSSISCLTCLTENNARKGTPRSICGLPNTVPPEGGWGGAHTAVAMWIPSSLICL